MDMMHACSRAWERGIYLLGKKSTLVMSSLPSWAHLLTFSLVVDGWCGTLRMLVLLLVCAVLYSSLLHGLNHAAQNNSVNSSRAQMSLQPISIQTHTYPLSFPSRHFNNPTIMLLLTVLPQSFTAPLHNVLLSLFPFFD